MSKAYSTSHESQGNLAERAIDCLWQGIIERNCFSDSVEGKLVIFHLIWTRRIGRQV